VTDEEAQAFIPVFNDRKQPVVLTGPNADIFSTTDKTPYAWRTGCTFNQDGHDPAKWFVEKHGPGTYYFICWKFSSTPGLAAAVAAGVAAGGAKLAPTIFTPFPVTGNFEPYLTQVKNGKAKGLITFVGGSDAASLLQQFDSFGLNGKIPLMGVGAACEPNTIPAVANYVNGTYGCEFYIPGLKNAANSAFKSVYSASYKSSPNYYAVAAYDAASYIDKVLTRTKGDTSDKSRLEDALSQPYVLDSPRGSTTMNTKYQCLTTPMYVWQNHGSGKSVKQTVVNTSFPAPET
jgi:branched-chain amino acid transport system substrate-binding protein